MGKVISQWFQFISAQGQVEEVSAMVTEILKYL
jgi:hypothetical protein